MAQPESQSIDVVVVIRGLSSTWHYFCEKVTFKMQGSDTVAALKDKIQEKKGVPAWEQVLRTCGGVMRDSVKLGDTFNLNGTHGFYLWLCNCSACFATTLLPLVDDEISITIENAPAPLTMAVKPSFTVSFLETYLNMIFQGSAEISYQEKWLCFDARTLGDYGVRNGSCIRSVWSSLNKICKVINTTIMSDSTSDSTTSYCLSDSTTSYCLSDSTTCRDLRNSIEFVLGIPSHHQFLSSYPGKTPLKDDHRLEEGLWYNYWCGLPDETLSKPGTQSATDAAASFQIQVMTLGRGLQFHVNAADTVAMVKERIRKQDVKIACNKQRLLLDGEMLDDSGTLLDNNVKEGSVLTLLIEGQSGCLVKYSFPWCCFRKDSASS